MPKGNNKTASENVVTTITTSINYAQVIGQGRFIILNIADKVIGKFKNDNGNIIEEERPVIKVATAYLLKQLIECNTNVASAMRRSKNVSSTLCSCAEGAKITVNIIKHLQGETYGDEDQCTYEYDKYDYRIQINKLDDEVIELLKQAKRADFGL